MSQSNPNYTISASNTTPAVTVSNNTLTIDSSASLKLGGVTLTEDKFAKMEAMLEFVERFVEEDERAKAIWTAIKAKKRILG